MPRETEVLVVGAGPTGLTLATLLRRSGIACDVIDKATGRSTTSKAIGLQYRVSEILAWMGLVDGFIARAAEQTTVNLLVQGKSVAKLALGKLTPASPGAFAPRPLIVPQSDTEALLSEALEALGTAVEYDKELVDLSQDACKVEALLADGERIQARYLVSCEGAHSVARRQVGIAFAGKTYPHDFVMADVAMDSELRRGEAYSFLHPRGVFSIITMPGERRWRLFIEAGETHVDDVTLDLVRTLYVERTGDQVSRISDPTWLTRFKIHARIVERFRERRVFLAGDAAHLHSPSGGQGITTGMQDATNLAWKLIHVLRFGADEALLDSYDEERRPAARAVLIATDRNTRLLFPRSAFAKWFRDRIFLPLLGTQLVQQRLVEKMSQLHVGYRASSLSQHATRRFRAGLKAGDRTPDVRLSGGDTLFELLRNGQLVALLGRAVDALPAQLETLGVRVALLGDAASQVFGSSADVWLVRPDGYVLSRSALTDSASLIRVLCRVFAAARVDAAFAPCATPSSPAVSVT